uniref:Mucin 2, oligomeric mucus/gel-forming n=1 Tax=Meleagris gallopavo TaxID=9103 RepID=A0A803XKC0_MELGA
MAGRTRNHGHYVCSTWGNNHFKTFDGDIYQFPGMCEYNFVSDCQDSYREFSVHIQRALNSNNHPEIQYILITITDFTVYLKPKLAVVDGRIVKTPYYSSGLLIESNDVYTKVYAKLGLILIWNQEDALMVELDSKFGNQTCGLCGDYNGVPIYNEFISGGDYNSITYGNLQKISKPNDECEDPDETQALPSCNEHRDECEKLLTSSAFADCHSRLNLEMYIQACMQDKCSCKGNEDSFCLCSTISEYSRQCSHAGGRPGEWRTENFCYKTCPGNMVYRESSSPCMDTCSHLEVSSLCEEHYMDGCFCPEGTVYDDITENGCVPVSQCYCRLHGKGYSPGETISNECEECTCDSGRWTCKDLPCPGTCSVEGGSHITTFDGKKYTFHGDCYYVLAKSAVNNTHALLAELAPCGSTDGQTCLKTVVLLVDDKKNVVVFRSDGSVSLNEMTVNVPHVSASFSVFKPSSYYLIVHTSFGLQLQIQLSPVMQLFVTMDQSVQDLQGLCGNFNGMEGDDFKTTSGLVEATGSAFANTWKAQSTCADQVEKLEDPCSLSIESANYAEHWCSLLKNSEGPFARCHSVIDPAEYYKRCKYDTCLCKDSEECLCAALSSYSRACAFKGIVLGGWRQSVCSDEVSACPGNQVFLYNLTMCQQTCRSIADGEKYCLQDFAPVDGCGCPDNTYLDNQDTCVPISKCPCYYKGSYLEPGDYVTKDGERWYVLLHLPVCWDKTPFKIAFLSVSHLAINYYQSECVSGCVCPEGLFDDGRGGCVVEEDCPCIHNSDWYNHGQSITVDCNTCTCQKGIWSCTENVCYGTCMIYGSGHYITFDGKFYDFDGSCEYVATQDYCGDKNSGGSFSIITENVPCGTTGVTCSKAIKMFIGKTELKLENKDYKEIQRDVGDDVYYQNKTVGLYLVIEASNGVMLIWDKKTTVFIKLTPDYKGKVCGLCGNFDGKSNNDFTSRSGLQETSALEFGNSWKQSSVCPDVTEEIKPCDLKPHRKPWAEKECSLILSEIFKICHSKVNPSPFYDACVHDACSCDSGGDCDCFCSAVAAYAQECTKAQACVFWRSPDICPIFCDYYNPRNECEWHYEPCGSNVMTCRMIYNVSTNFSVPYLEGCYPRCPHEKPIYNEETKECVAADECWCYHNGNPVIIGGEIPTEENCTKWYVKMQVFQEIILKDGDICTIYVCAENGSVILGGSYPCPLTTSPSTITTSPGTNTITTIAPCLGLICDWSEWFDVSNPEEDGGDYETYEEIRKEHGNKICAAPENIECRAKDSPDKTLEELGQKVECNVTYGLICKNEEQDASIWHLCYNYEIRVNCCEWHEFPCETASTPSSIPTASSVTTGTTVPTTTIRHTTAPPTTTGSAPTTTSGTTLSSSTTSSTVSTTPVTVTTSSGPTSVTSSPLLTPSGSMSPPSVSTVPSTVTTSGTTPTKPFTTTSGTTSSSFSTVTATTITTSEIVSSGSASTSGTTPISSTVTVSGSSTYSTVTTLSTLSSTASPSSNCTISPNETYAVSEFNYVYFCHCALPGESWWLCNCIQAICVENNTVVIVPVICEPPPKPTCSNGLAPVQVIDDDQCCWHWECDCYCTGWGDPHYLTFDGLYYSYQGNCTYVLVEEIEKTVDNFGVYIDNYHCDARDVVSCPRALIVRHETQEVRIVTVKPNTLEVEVTVNKQAVALPYKKFGLKIYESGINRVVEIPELKMNVTFNGLSFSIRMPYSLFGNNTQGQCGTCNNNMADDCRLPNGNIAENCETMADHWQVVDPSKPQCSPGLVPTKAPSTTTGQPCKESSLCELLWGSVFEKCHQVVKPDKYYAACVFDSCMLPDLDLECSSLQIYAAVCADQNVCIDWRSHTNGVCSYECPKHKEYRACGPIQETTFTSHTMEGCFCPNGTMLYDSGVDVCVNTCGCVGLDMIPREFGEKFIADCQDCVCLEGGNGIVCEPHKCPEQNKRSCSGKGFYEVTEVNSEDPCCPIVTCKCNTSLCTTKPPKCTLGFEVQSYIPSDECCPVYQCVFVDKCHDCFCTNDVNISTQLNVISCEHIPCNTYCEPVSDELEGECCGKCVQTKCIIHTSHGSSLILNPGEFTNDPYNNCTIYSCTSLKNQLFSSTSEITCPAFSEESCKPGTVTFLPNGCCKTCKYVGIPKLTVQKMNFHLISAHFIMYSVEASSMEHSCSCCKEVETSMKEVELKCPSGGSITHKYVYVESCGCQDTQCTGLEGTSRDHRDQPPCQSRFPTPGRTGRRPGET